MDEETYSCTVFISPPGIELRKRQTEITEGTLLYFSAGAWSDYHVIGVYRALKEFDVETRHADFVERQKAFGHYSDYSNSGFIQAMTRDGFIEEVPCREVHLDD